MTVIQISRPTKPLPTKRSTAQHIPSTYQYDPLIPPSLLRHDLPVPAVANKTISAARRTAAAIVQGSDPLDRLLVIVGPCSIHDVDQAKEYAGRLRAGVQEGKWPGLEIVMRVYL